jgi:hypothetical protein
VSSRTDKLKLARTKKVEPRKPSQIESTTWLTVLFLLSLPGLGDGPSARDIGVKVKPGEFVVDHLTLINLEMVTSTGTTFTMREPLR